MDRSSITRFLLLSIVVPLLSATPRPAHGYAWQEISPRGGGAVAIAVDANPTTLYAVSDWSGLYRSDDGGATWTALDPFVNHQAPHGMLGIGSDPSTPGTVFAATWEYVSCSTCFTATFRVSRSTNRGDVWSVVHQEEVGIPINFPGYNVGIAVDSQSPPTVHVGGFVRSLDGGTTWTHPTTPYLFEPVTVVDPTNPQVVWLGTPRGLLWKSVDGGDTYTNVGGNPAVAALAIDPASGAVYIGGDGVARSDDGGTTWTPAAALPTAVSALAVRDGVVFAGTAGVKPPNGAIAGSVFRSTDRGATWTERGAGIPHVSGIGSGIGALAVAPTSHAVWAGSDAFGVYRTDSDGLDWRAPNNGFFELRAVVAVDPLVPTTLHAATARGYFRSHDRGASWALRMDGLQELDFRAVAVDPQAPATLYLAAASAGGVYKSLDGGTTWAPSNTGLGILAGSIQTIAIDPVTPSNVYLGHDPGFSNSSDAGATWTFRWPPSFTALSLVIDPTAPSTMYACGFTWGVNKSVDGGGMWMQSNAGMAATNIQDVALDPQAPQRLYAVEATFFEEPPAPVYTSGDGADSWTPTAALPTEVRAVAVNPTTSAVYVAGLGTAYESPAGGAAWTPLGTPLPFAIVEHLVVDPPGRELYAAGGSPFGVAQGIARLQLAPCATDADCDDANACTADACDTMTGACSNTPLADAAACSDGDPCTTDVCVAGACRSSLDPCSVCVDPSDADGDGVNDGCDATDGLLAVRSVKIVRSATKGVVVVKGTAVLGPNGDAIVSSAGLGLVVQAADGLVASASWSAADCKVAAARIACASTDRRYRLKIRATKTAPGAPRFAARLRGLAVAAVPTPPVTVELDETGRAIARVGAIASCATKASSLACRTP